MVQSSIKPRLDYLDASRGLAIFTVVYSHICLFCVPGYSSSSTIIDFLRYYFLNGFFFISGFLVSNKVCNFSNFLPQLWKRFTQLLVPALIIGLIYAYSHNISFQSFFFNEAKYGYWFTISLFEMYIAYIVYSLVVNRLASKPLSNILFVIICFLAYFIFKYIPISQNVSDLLCLNSTIFYIPFFSLGILASQFKSIILSKIAKWRKILIFLIFTFIGLCYCFPIPLLIQRILIVIFVIWMIRELFLEQSTNRFITGIKKFLLLVGKNSLEIYFIHYFLLFPLPVEIGEYLQTVATTNQSLSMVEFLIIGTMSVVLSLSSILLSKILKEIPYVSRLAFGRSVSYKLK